MHPNETRIYLAILTGVLILATFIVFFILTIIRYQRKKVALYKDKIKTELNSLEKERLRIAIDLHDDLGASLSAIKLRLQCLNPDKEDDLLTVIEAKNYIDSAMHKLRQVSFNIMPRILQRNGLPDALNDLIEMLTYTSNIKTHVNCTFNPEDGEVRVHIYRIIQEILNNSIKHSMADEIHLLVHKKGKMIVVHFRDNGIGFDKYNKFNNSVRQGLQNIMARVDVLKAKMYLTTNPGKGVDYLIKIPYNNDDK